MHIIEKPNGELAFRVNPPADALGIHPFILAEYGPDCRHLTLQSPEDSRDAALVMMPLPVDDGEGNSVHPPGGSLIIDPPGSLTVKALNASGELVHAFEAVLVTDGESSDPPEEP